MRRFLKNILIIGAIMFSILFGIELLLLTKPNDYSYKRKYIESHLDGIKVLFLGHSYFEVGINPAVIGDSVFNAAISGRAAGNTWDAQLAERYVPKMKNLKVLALPFAYHHIYETKSITPESRSNIRTYKCMNYKYLGLTSGSFSLRFWPELLNSNLNFWARLSTKASKVQCDSLGFIAFPDRAENWQTEHLPDTEPTKADLNKVLLQDYLRIAAVCKENGVSFVIIATPIYDTYRQIISEKWQVDAEKIISEVRKSFPEVLFYNFAFDSRFTEDYFKDAGHLNEQGAKMFSEIVKEEVL